MNDHQHSLKILVTCPPMLGMIDSFLGLFAQHGLTVTAPKVVQTLAVKTVALVGFGDIGRNLRSACSPPACA